MVLPGAYILLGPKIRDETDLQVPELLLLFVPPNTLVVGPDEIWQCAAEFKARPERVVFKLDHFETHSQDAKEGRELVCWPTLEHDQIGGEG